MKKIIPEDGKIILSRDGCVRVGKNVIGWWESDIVGGSSHFRPSPYEGMRYYRASLNNGDCVNSYSQAGLRDEIIASGQEGIEPVEY